MHNNSLTNQFKLEDPEYGDYKSCDWCEAPITESCITYKSKDGKKVWHICSKCTARFRLLVTGIL